ncbi:MAG: hypothetical protein J0M01_15795 [Dechloromonas sp.]|nr:hypothetical protein [Dechloromonas sp.]
MTIAVAAITASLTFVAPVLADDAHHPEKATAAGQSTPTLKGMQDNVKKMRGQLDRVAKARTDSERQQALAEHMHTMQENMALARRMAAGMDMGCPMMGSGMGMGMGMGQMGGSPSSAMPADRLQQMEKRMDMMEQMIKRQGDSPAPIPAK